MDILEDLQVCLSKLEVVMELVRCIHATPDSEQAGSRALLDSVSAARNAKIELAKVLICLPCQRLSNELFLIPDFPAWANLLAGENVDVQWIWEK